MSSSISTLSGASPILFSGTQAEAKTEVKKLRNTLLSREQAAPFYFLKEIVLLKRPAITGDQGTVSFCLGSPRDIEIEQQEQTKVYVQSLLEKAYPADDSLEMEMTHRGFATYLSKSNLSAKEMLSQINELHLIQVTNKAFEAGEKADALPFAQDEPEEIIGSQTAFLASKEVEVHRNDRLGAGCFGVVMSAAVKGENGKYVYKKEKIEVAKALTEWNPSFWREGDCAATQLNNLSNLTKPLFFIFSVRKAGEKETTLHYVPVNHVKAFGMKLPRGSKVFLEGQLMERAKGESLGKMMLTNSMLLYPKGKHFPNIVRGLFHIIQEMEAHNLVHHDLKPDNIFYDVQTGKVTLLDFGSAQRLRKKEKIDDESHRYKPTSDKIGGTLKYVSPRVIQEQQHGSEIDLFSFAMTVLELVSEKDVMNFTNKRFPDHAQENNSDAIFTKCDAAEYLDRFLDVVAKEEGASQKSQGRSKTERTLGQNPELKMVIDLAFQASAGGVKGAAAYEQLKRLPYFQTESSPAMIDSPATTGSVRTNDSPVILG